MCSLPLHCLVHVGTTIGADTKYTKQSQKQCIVLAGQTTSWGSARSYSSLSAAQTECTSFAKSCSGVYDTGCDGKAPYYMCKTAIALTAAERRRRACASPLPSGACAGGGTCDADKICTSSRAQGLKISQTCVYKKLKGTHLLSSQRARRIARTHARTTARTTGVGSTHDGTSVCHTRTACAALPVPCRAFALPCPAPAALAWHAPPSCPFLLCPALLYPTHDRLR